MKWFVRLAATLWVVALPSAVNACGIGPFGRALIHSALPTPFPEGLFIAKVGIDRSTLRRYRRTGARARVREIVQGDPHVSRILLRPELITSCDAPWANGTTGLIVGIPRERKGDTLIVEPIMAYEQRGFRLPDGYYVSAECRQTRCPVVIAP